MSTVAREIYTAINNSNAELLENALKNFDANLDPSLEKQLEPLSYDQDLIVRILFSAIPFLSQDDNQELAHLLGSEHTLQDAISELHRGRLVLLGVLITLIQELQSLDTISAHLQMNIIPKFKPVVETK